jgi:hypothetical protein
MEESLYSYITVEKGSGNKNQYGKNQKGNEPFSCSFIHLNPQVTTYTTCYQWRTEGGSNPPSTRRNSEAEPNSEIRGK